MRFFNTTGPIRAAKHYCIPPLERLNLAEVRAADSGREILRFARTASDG